MTSLSRVHEFRPEAALLLIVRAGFDHMRNPVDQSFVWRDLVSLRGVRRDRDAGPTKEAWHQIAGKRVGGRDANVLEYVAKCIDLAPVVEDRSNGRYEPLKRSTESAAQNHRRINRLRIFVGAAEAQVHDDVVEFSDHRAETVKIFKLAIPVIVGIIAIPILGASD